MTTRFKIGFSVLVFILFYSSALFAEKIDTQLKGKVAVVSLDLPVNTAAEQSVLKALADAGVEPLSPSKLQSLLDESKSEKPSPEVAGKMAKMSATIAKGVEKFFYESEKKSIQYLQPVFDLGLNNISALARRADYADQIFQAGLLLIRAYEIRNQKEEAKTIVDLMIRNFPTQPFTTSVIPPKVVTRLKAARQNLAESQTTLELVNKDENEQCVAYLNGVEAPLNKAIFVAPNVDYHMRLDCGVENQAVWKTRVNKGEKLSAPITAGNPLIIGLSANDLKARQSAENALHAIMFWAKLDHIIGVSENFKKENRNVLLVRIQKGDFPKWSDGASTEDIYKALARLFPNLPQGSYEKPEEDSEGGSSIWGPVILGTGVVVTGVGVGLLITAIDADNTLNCVTNVDEPSCDNPTKSITTENYDKQADEIATREMISWITIGAGAATMIAGGLIWYFDGDDSGIEENVALTIDPVHGNYSMGFRTSF